MKNKKIAFKIFKVIKPFKHVYITKYKCYQIYSMRMHTIMWDFKKYQYNGLKYEFNISLV